MRSTLATFGLCSLFMLTGCTNESWGFLRKAPDPAITNGPTPTAAALVTYLNGNSQRIHSMSCMDVDLDIQQGLQPMGGITGKMACEQPRAFRMNAGIMGKPEFELGSNDREFWYWIARNNPPYQYFCSYEDLRTKNVPLPFPFQPEWVMETLGMAKYDPNGQYRVEQKGATIELIQDTTSLQGQPVRKVVVFNRASKANGAQIQKYLLRDMQGKEICSAEILDVQRVGDIVVPSKLLLSWPADKTKLTMKFNKPTVNQVSPEMAQSLFDRKPLKDSQPFDLARLARGGFDGQVQQAGGYNTKPFVGRVDRCPPWDLAMVTKSAGSSRLCGMSVRDPSCVSLAFYGCHQASNNELVTGSWANNSEVNARSVRVPGVRFVWEALRQRLCGDDCGHVTEWVQCC